MAAGLGFKTFTTGEVLSAANVNGYLMQGVLVFASAAARDAAITAPAEGQFAYLKDTNVTTYYTGSAWANLDTTGMTNPMTTTGDTIYSSSGSTPARLAIGSTGNVLTVAGGLPTWAAPAAGGGLTLLSTTTLAASEVNITGISQSYKMLMIELTDVKFTAGNSPIQIRLDGENGGHFGGVFYQNSFQAYGDSPAYLGPNTSDNKVNTGNNVTMFVYNYTNASFPKPFQLVGNMNFTTGQEKRGLNGFGVFTPARVIDSVTIFNDNSMTGTVKIYGGN